MRDSIIADVKILPFGTATPSLSHYIAECVNILEQAPDIKYLETPMSTIVEGPLERVKELVLRMHEIPFTKGVERVVTNISIDDRRDKRITMESKVQAIAVLSGLIGTVIWIKLRHPCPGCFKITCLRPSLTKIVSCGDTLTNSRRENFW